MAKLPPAFNMAASLFKPLRPSDMSEHDAPARPASRRVLIAEDNPEQLTQIVEILGRLRPDWTVVATAADLVTLKTAIDEHVPNLLMLDVHLMDGRTIDFFNSLPYPVPVVLISGDPAAAVDAFEYAVVDYILKPATSARVERALARVEALSETRQSSEPPNLRKRWITARKGQGTAIVQMSDVLYFQAQTKYTRVVMREGEALLNRGLGMVETELDPNQFLRIHRSTIVNIAHAGTLMRDDLGRLKLQVKGRSDWLFVSKPYERCFKQ